MNTSLILTTICFIAIIAFLFYKKNWKLLLYCFLYYRKKISQNRNLLGRCLGVSTNFFLFIILYLLIEYLPRSDILDALIAYFLNNPSEFLDSLKENKLSIIIVIMIIDLILMIFISFLIIKSPLKQKEINNNLIKKNIINYKNKNIISYFGSIKDVRDIKVIVTSENSDLDLASLSSTSISGRVRCMASTKNLAGEIIKDSLLDNINDFKKKNKKYSNYKLGTCVFSLPFELKKQGVEHIIHAVSIKKNSDNTITCEDDAIKEIIKISINFCIKNSCDSIFIPIFGIGSAQRDYVKSINVQLENLKFVLDNELIDANYDLNIYLGVYHEIDNLYLKKTAIKLFR